MPGTHLPRQRVILPLTSSVPLCYHPSWTKHKDTVTPARPPQFAAQWEVSASCKKAACLLPWGQGRRGGKGAPGELQIINNHFSCCSNSRIEPGRTGRAGGTYNRVPGFRRPPGSPVPGAHGAAGHKCPPRSAGDAGGSGRAPPAPRRCCCCWSGAGTWQGRAAGPRSGSHRQEKSPSLRRRQPG